MNVVIAGSAKLQEYITSWVAYWNEQAGHAVIDSPKAIPADRFDELYPDVHKEFFRNIERADILFVANGTKDGIEGYIGAETFAEMAYALAQKLIHGRNIRIILANEPSAGVACFDEIAQWKRLGWISQLTEAA